MDYTNLRRQIISMKKSLFDQGYLDEQFNQLEELQDDSSPNFVEEVVALFLKDSSRLLTNIEQALEKYPQDFYQLDSLVHQFKGSGSSIGALRMKNECSMFKAHCNDRNLEGYRTLDDSSSSIPASHSLLEQLHLIPWLTQMPPVTPEDEEGACHSEAEAGDIFSFAEASRSSRTRGEFMEVTRIDSMGGSSKGNKRVGSLCSFGRVLYTPQVLLSCWCALLLLMGDVSRCPSVCGLCTVWCLAYTLLAPW